MTRQIRKYAIVDLEATSAGSNAKIIQVGIVIVENGEITQSYETDVNPHERLDEHIKQLTGLTDARLRKAPEFAQVAKEIFELINDAVFVAHNVRFDANLLAEALFWEGFELTTPRIDTVELSQIFYPTLERYNLGALASELGIELHHAHSALADATATAQLLLKLREKIAGLPRGLLEELLSMADCLIYESRLLIEDAYEESSAFLPPILKEVHGLYVKKQRQPLESRHLSEQFDLNMQLLGMEAYPEQKQFASYIEEGLKHGSPSFIEAPTGIGKTYAYLLTLLAKTSKRIIVSVPTKILQDQLMKKEAQAIQDLFQVSFHSLKSPKEYLQLDKFYETLHRESDNRMVQRFKMQLLVWLTITETGELSEVGQLYRHTHFVAEICHDGQLSKRSLFYQEDFWRLGQEKVKTSRVILTNHAYLLTRLEDDQSLLEDAVLVVDEAQKLFFALEQFSQKELSLTSLLMDIQHCLDQEKDLLQRRLLESIQFELNACSKEVAQGKRAVLSEQTVAKMRQDVRELANESLENLKELFAERYQSYWIDKETFEDHHIMHLHAGVEGLLSFQDFLTEDVPVFFVSATIGISRKVDLPSLLGYRNQQMYQVPSERKQHQELLLPIDFADVVSLSASEYALELSQLVEDLLPLGKPIFLLFTSKELLLETSNALKVPHLAQYRNGDAANIKRRFDRGESSILLGTGSFWEGVDFSHQNEVIQIITRLPFDNPKEFMVQKVNAQLRDQGKNPFYDYSLPVAILRIKQAIGRTSRSDEQESLVLLLDQRVLTKRYGKQILDGLKQVLPLQTTLRSQLVDQAQHFFERNTEK
ncbi:bifunctional DnaQ family exonuclease/ATP-dependent helicase [uncultured Streptococcus sp.]|uniref:bifunctional DnaQ family exonuclease/ATP-dependent helicase n=1 Tax=uncultured Streptococcus sp. TaxID=83427 RepID=UPI0026761664|nr:bifunctional DnaQ family exonuclease/ATP-dependent helicase [uncultured Streptococcus sp.]